MLLQQSWRERAIQRSEGITDAWEVTKIYAGRLAEWVLFLCMIMNIIEILVSVPTVLSNTVLAIQAVTLDIGGFSLASMADAAQEAGSPQEARKARATGWLLISIMMLTLLLVSIGVLWPQVKSSMDGAEKGLILVRALITVLYGHVVHSLRRRVRPVLTQEQVVALEDRLQQKIDAFHLLPPPLPPVPADEIKAMIQAQSHVIIGEMSTQLSSIQEKLQGQIEAMTMETLDDEEDEEEEEEMETPDETEKEEEDTTSTDVEDAKSLPPLPRITVKLTEELPAQKKEPIPGKKRATKGKAPTALQKAQRALQQNPEMTAAELARKIKKTPQYAGRILRQCQEEKVPQKEVDPSH